MRAPKPIPLLAIAVFLLPALRAQQPEGQAQAAFEGNLASHKMFEGLSADELSRLTDLAADALRDGGGGKNRLKAMADGLPSRSQRLTAYGLAAEISSDWVARCDAQCAQATLSRWR